MKRHPIICLLRKRLRRLVCRVLHLLHILRLIQSPRRFGWHVVFVVLGHDLISVENSVRANATLSHAPAPFFKKVWQDAFVNNWNSVRCISNSEANCQPIILAFQTSIFDQAANAKGLIHRGFFRCDLGRTEKENQVLAKSSEDEPCRQSDCCQAGNDESNSLVTFLHEFKCSISFSFSLNPIAIQCDKLKLIGHHRGFKFSVWSLKLRLRRNPRDSSPALQQHEYFAAQKNQGNAIGSPHVEAIATHSNKL